MAEIKVYTDAARDILRNLPHGLSVSIPLPLQPTDRRTAYRRIAGVAHKLWGAGNYKVEAFGNSMHIERVGPIRCTRAYAEARLAETPRRVRRARVSA